MTCEPFRHDFKPDPRPANWRDGTCTCTRCGEIRGAFDGRTIQPTPVAPLPASVVERIEAGLRTYAERYPQQQEALFQ